tara:strand:- start:178 stop:531 length:354 start_codon:yes stop_codon:yes gene_type:complete
MKLSSKNLYELGIIDEIISEPLGGAHRDKDLIVNNVKLAIQKNLDELSSMNREEIFYHRKNKFLSIGRKKGFTSKLDVHESLSMQDNLSQKSFNFINKYKIIILIVLLIISIISYYL